MKKIFSLLAAVLLVGSIGATDLLSIDFTQGQGEWTIDDKELGGLEFVWAQTAQYGMKATGYVNGNHATESWLISPAIDLSAVESAKLSFSHARRYGDLSQLSVQAKAGEEGEWTVLEVSAWPDGNNWNYIDAEADLAALVGKDKVQIAFVYTSTEQGGATWEIKTVSVSDGEVIPIEEPDVVILGSDFKGQGTPSTGSAVTLTKDGVTFSCDKAYGDTVYGSLRCYKNGVVTITSEGEQIGKLVFQFPTVSGTYYNGGLPDEVVVNGQEWSATLTSQARFDKISVYFGEYEEITIDTLNVAEAIAKAEALNNGQTSAEKYFIEGYAVNVADYYVKDGTPQNQDFYFVDDAAQPDSVMKVFRATPKKDGKPYPVLAGDKLRLFGALQKYAPSEGAVQLEIVTPTVEFLEEVEGDRTIVEPEPEKLDTISVQRALEIGEALADGGVTPVKYVIGGYVSSIESYFDPTYKNETFWIVDEKGSKAASNADGAFYVFRGTPTPAEEIGLNAKVFVTCKIKKYVKEGKAPVIENEKANDAVNVVEKGEEEVVEAITVAQALEIGLALADQGVSDKRYEITGFVSSIDSYFDATYKNETFWITDSLGSRASGTANGAFEIYRGKPNTEKEIGLDAKIKIVCKIKNYKGTIENDGTGIVFEVLEQGQDLVFDTITVARAIEIGMALEDNATTDVDYVVNGYVVKAYEPDSGYTNQNFYMADFLDEYGEFYAYRCTPDKQVVAGDFLYVLGKIQKYVKNDKVTIELSYGTATHGDVPAIDTIHIDVKKAVEIGMELAKETKTAEYYLVTGYVANITSEFDEEEKNESFWMNDEEDAVEGKFFANLARIAEPGAGLHQKVAIFGRIQHYVDEEGESIIRIDKGSAKLINDEGIENVVLTEQATKVLVDGVLYIIRDNKMYNIQGARVR